MRVYLSDLCYLNDWDTNHPVPLNVGSSPTWSPSSAGRTSTAEIADALERLQAETGSLLSALYRVRINLIGKIVGDRVFCYRRTTAASEVRDHQHAVDAAHANLAARN